MMRKEISMNVFPFGDDGTDPSIVIRSVRYFVLYFQIQNQDWLNFYNFIITDYNFVKYRPISLPVYLTNFYSADVSVCPLGARNPAGALSLVDFEKFRVRAATLRTPPKGRGRIKHPIFQRIIQRKFLKYKINKTVITN